MTNTKLNATVALPSKMAISNAVAARVQIQSIWLAETRVRRSLDKGRLPTKISIEVNATPITGADSQAIGVCANFVLSGRYKEADTGEPPLYIQATFILDYSLTSNEGLTQHNYDAFAELNGVHNAWPYWREYVQSVLIRMGMPPLTIPVYRVIPGDTRSPEVPSEKKPARKQNRRARPRKRSD